jgi:hypothetical protein
VLVTGVDWGVLIPLVVGGTPGTFLGARIANWVSQSVIRRGIVIVLTLTGLRMLGVPPEMVGIIGAGLLLLGPLVWGFVRQTRGLPAFDNNLAAWRVPERRGNGNGAAGGSNGAAGGSGDTGAAGRGPSDTNGRGNVRAGTGRAQAPSDDLR